MQQLHSNSPKSRNSRHYLTPQTCKRSRRMTQGTSRCFTGSSLTRRTRSSVTRQVSNSLDQLRPHRSICEVARTQLKPTSSDKINSPSQDRVSNSNRSYTDTDSNSNSNNNSNLNVLIFSCHPRTSWVVVYKSINKHTRH